MRSSLNVHLYQFEQWYFCFLEDTFSNDKKEWRRKKNKNNLLPLNMQFFKQNTWFLNVNVTECLNLTPSHQNVNFNLLLIILSLPQFNPHQQLLFLTTYISHNGIFKKSH